MTKQWWALPHFQTTYLGESGGKESTFPAISTAEYEKTHKKKKNRWTPSGFRSWLGVGEGLWGLFEAWEYWQRADELCCELKFKLVKTRWPPQIRPSPYTVRLVREIPDAFFKCKLIKTYLLCGFHGEEGKIFPGYRMWIECVINKLFLPLYVCSDYLQAAIMTWAE